MAFVPGTDTSKTGPEPDQNRQFATRYTTNNLFFLDFEHVLSIDEEKEKPIFKEEDPDEEIKEELKVEPPFIDEISPPASYPVPPSNDPPILPVKTFFFVWVFSRDFSKFNSIFFFVYVQIIQYFR